MCCLSEQQVWLCLQQIPVCISWGGDAGSGQNQLYVSVPQHQPAGQFSFVELSCICVPYKAGFDSVQILLKLLTNCVISVDSYKFVPGLSTRFVASAHGYLDPSNEELLMNCPDFVVLWCCWEVTHMREVVASVRFIGRYVHSMSDCSAAVLQNLGCPIDSFPWWVQWATAVLPPTRQTFID